MMLILLSAISETQNIKPIKIEFVWRGPVVEKPKKTHTQKKKTSHLA